MLPLGTPAPHFELPDPDGTYVSLRAFDGADAFLIMFICNHCPFVKLLRKTLVKLARDYGQRNVAIIGINSNDFEQYPDDSPGKMAEIIAEYNYPFPYLIDADQSVAKAYRAACTPDFFIFDHKLLLTYRGQFDESRPGNGVPTTGLDVRTALDSTLDHEIIPNDVQKPSMGCSIKWKPGNVPDYFR